MPKMLLPDTQNSIQMLLKDTIDPAVIGKRAGVHRNTDIRYANTVVVKIGLMFSYFAYTRCGLLHFLVYSNVVYTIRKSKLWETLW
jgi:hypothetical protein